MKTLKDEWYVAIKAYKFTVFEILRDFCIIIYCMSVLSLHIQSTNSIILYMYIQMPAEIGLCCKISCLTLRHSALTQKWLHLMINYLMLRHLANMSYETWNIWLRIYLMILKLYSTIENLADWSAATGSPASMPAPLSFVLLTLRLYYRKEIKIYQWHVPLACMTGNCWPQILQWLVHHKSICQHACSIYSVTSKTVRKIKLSAWLPARNDEHSWHVPWQEWHKPCIMVDSAADLKSCSEWFTFRASASMPAPVSVMLLLSRL